MAQRHKDQGIVYSTDQGKMCPQCGNPVKDCSCKQDKNLLKGDGIVRISRETKGRKGKGVTVISGLLLPPGELKKTAKKLKQKCGTGGTVKNGTIEIQGDHRNLLFEELSQQGFKVKISGG